MNISVSGLFNSFCRLLFEWGYYLLCMLLCLVSCFIAFNVLFVYCVCMRGMQDFHERCHMCEYFPNCVFVFVFLTCKVGCFFVSLYLCFSVHFSFWFSYDCRWHFQSVFFLYFLLCPICKKVIPFASFLCKIKDAFLGK